MAYGPVNAPGVSGLEFQAVVQAIDDFKNEIFMGEVTTPLTTHTGEVITTESGEPVLARRPLITRQDTDALEARINAVAASIDTKISAHNASAASHPTFLSVR